MFFYTEGEPQPQGCLFWRTTTFIFTVAASCNPETLWIYNDGAITVQSQSADALQSSRLSV